MSLDVLVREVFSEVDKYSKKYILPEDDERVSQTETIPLAGKTLGQRKEKEAYPAKHWIDLLERR